MKKERPLFIHIEQLQDLVENLLIELNYGRVALAYGKYRGAPRRRARTSRHRSRAGGGEQLELASPALDRRSARCAFPLHGSACSSRSPKTN